MDEYDVLKIENQLCFPLYACAKEIINKYRPFLDPMGLTYTQYIVMMVLWEKGECGVKEIGKALYLDSGTLTPVLKKLEAKGFIRRERSEKDERNLVIRVTAMGKELKKAAVSVPREMGECIPLSKKEAAELYRLLYKILRGGKID